MNLGEYVELLQDEDIVHQILHYDNIPIFLNMGYDELIKDFKESSTNKLFKENYSIEEIQGPNDKLPIFGSRTKNWHIVTMISRSPGIKIQAYNWLVGGDCTSSALNKNAKEHIEKQRSNYNTTLCLHYGCRKDTKGYEPWNILVPKILVDMIKYAQIKKIPLCFPQAKTIYSKRTEHNNNDPVYYFPEK